VEHIQKFNEQYRLYNYILIGRALFLSKVEEIAEVHVLVNINGLSTTNHALMDVAKAFDKRMVEIIIQWRHFLVGGEQSAWLYKKDDNEAVNVLVDKVNVTLRALKAHEVHLSPYRKNKQKCEDNDDFSLETKRQFQRVDMDLEITSRGPSVQGKFGPTTC